MQFLYTQNAINILTILSFKGFGNAWVAKNIKGNEKKEEIIKKINKNSHEEITLYDFNAQKEDIEKELKNLNGFCDGITALGDEDFPICNGNINPGDMPVCLFYKGDINLLSYQNTKPKITVIGLLTPDERIIRVEKDVVKKFIQKDAIILSGLANGCDSIAHKQALDSNGKTVAILPSPLNDILPKSNIQLASEILEQDGLLITEYYKKITDRYQLSQRYIKRDRLQALFSDTVVLTASYSKDDKDDSGKKLDSGSRHAMEFAKKCNIQRAVIYNQSCENDKMFNLNREIIEHDNEVITIENNIALDKIFSSNKKQMSLFA